MKARSLLPWSGLGLVVVLVVLVAGSGSERSDIFLDPRSTGPRGAKGVVVLLDELGADVEIGGSDLGFGDDTAVLLRDRLEAESRDRLLDWVDDGGVLVVADPSSVLHDDEGYCPAALDVVDRISFGSRPTETVDRGERCFERFASADDLGAGTIVSLDSPVLFVNGQLREDDNAVLAAALLAPTGEEDVAFVSGSIGTGEQALPDLLGPRAAQAIAQLAVAFVLYALWRGRRLGRAVVEPQPVTIAGSELVAAVGRMLGARRRPDEVAAVVRADLLRDLERRLGVAGGSVDVIAEAVAARTGMDWRRVADALADRPVLDEATLLDVLDDLDRIRSLVLQPSGPTRPATTAPGGT